MKTFLKFGLGSFLVFVIILVVFWVFFVDVFIENVIEAKGTEIVGAKVELDHADLTLFPSGLTLTRLQATNPGKPMTNAVDIDRIAMSLDVIPLLWRKVIVDEMSVEGVRFGTERQDSGVVPGLATRESAGEEFSLQLPALKVPDVKQILEHENLETVKLIETLKADVQRERDLWKKRLGELPGKAQLKKYKQRVKELKKSAKSGIGGVLSGVEDIQTLKKEIEQDVAEVKGAQREFKEKIALLKTRLAQIKTAPQRDVQHLKKKYNLSPQGLANLSQSLFGARISSWVHQATAWYERFKPYLDKDSQATETETPSASAEKDIDFLIRLAKVSMVLDAGEFSGTIHNITPAQAVFGKPLTFTFSGEKLKSVHSLALDGTLDHRQPAQSSDQVQFRAEGYKLSNIALSQDRQWPVSLNDGKADINMTASLQGKSLNAKGAGLLTDLHVSAGTQEDSNPLTQSISKAVSGISRLAIKANVTGTIDQYQVQLESDLDDVLKNVAGKMVNDVAARFSQDLQTEIRTKTTEPINNLQKSLSAFGSIGRELTDRLAQHNTVLEDLLKKGLSKKVLPGGLKLPF